MLAACGSIAHAADDPAAFLHQESFGGIRLEQSGQEVIKLLGQPEKEGPVTKQEADGNYVQTWRYPSKGLELTMSSAHAKDRAKSVAAILAKSPCPFKTRQGIQIGSAESATRKAYADHAERETSTETGVFIAGSVYGGIFFHFSHGKVSQIFFGAAAE
jgi:hypothetical protein